jgi:adenylate cyclase
MSGVRVLPEGVTVDVAPDATLLEALLLAKVPITHACGGHARCSTCRVRVTEGLERVTPRTEAERAMAEKLGLEDAIRLACQTKATGDLVARRLVLDPEDYELTKQLTQRPTKASTGREADVAVLFADIAGFTALSEALPAYDVVHVLHRWFHRASGVVEAHGGHVDNYMGDGLLAVFDVGAETAFAAVRTGLDLLHEAEGMARYLAAAYDRAFSIRVGVHHGHVVVGTPTPWERARDTVIGDTVNFASRIEAANKDLGSRLLVSDAVQRAVGARVRYGRSTELHVRGKRGVHALHEVLGLA